MSNNCLCLSTSLCYANYWCIKTEACITLMTPLFGETKDSLYKGIFFFCNAWTIAVIFFDETEHFTVFLLLTRYQSYTNFKAKRPCPSEKKVSKYIGMLIVSASGLEVTGQRHWGIFKSNLNILADFIQRRAWGRDDWHVPNLNFPFSLSTLRIIW